MSKKAPMLITEFGDGYQVSIKPLSHTTIPLKIARGGFMLFSLITILRLFSASVHEVTSGWVFEILMSILMFVLAGVMHLLITKPTYILVSPDYLFVRNRFFKTNKIAVPLSMIEGPVGVKSKHVAGEVPEECIELYIQEKGKKDVTVLYSVSYTLRSSNVSDSIGFFEMIASRISKLYEIEHKTIDRDVLLPTLDEGEEDNVVDKPWRIKFDEED
ncbi:MAG: hypothetical protein GY810_18825 [Aureispira sp.]|nr:hypothetical protein [Aureispira sp.]